MNSNSVELFYLVVEHKIFICFSFSVSFSFFKAL